MTRETPGARERSQAHERPGKTTEVPRTPTRRAPELERAADEWRASASVFGALAARPGPASFDPCAWIG